MKPLLPFGRSLAVDWLVGCARDQSCGYALCPKLIIPDLNYLVSFYHPLNFLISFLIQIIPCPLLLISGNLICFLHLRGHIEYIH